MNKIFNLFASLYGIIKSLFGKIRDFINPKIEIYTFDTDDAIQIVWNDIINRRSFFNIIIPILIFIILNIIIYVFFLADFLYLVKERLARVNLFEVGIISFIARVGDFLSLFVLALILSLPAFYGIFIFGYILYYLSYKILNYRSILKSLTFKNDGRVYFFDGGYNSKENVYICNINEISSFEIRPARNFNAKKIGIIFRLSPEIREFIITNSVVICLIQNNGSITPMAVINRHSEEVQLRLIASIKSAHANALTILGDYL